MKPTLKVLSIAAAVVVFVPAELLFVGVPNVPVTMHERRFISGLKIGTPRSELVGRARSIQDQDAIAIAGDNSETTYRVTFYNWLRFMVESGDTITMTFSHDGKLVSWKAQPARLY